MVNNLEKELYEIKLLLQQLIDVIDKKNKYILNTPRVTRGTGARIKPLYARRVV